MNMPTTHNNYPLLRRQIGSDSLVRVKKLITDAIEKNEEWAINFQRDSDLGSLFVSINARFEFANSAWTGTYENPEWAAVEIQDGMWTFQVTYDWTESTVLADVI